MIKSQLEAIRLRIPNYKDDQAKADTLILVKAVETLLKETTIQYHSQFRPLLSNGIWVRWNIGVNKPVWKAWMEIGSQTADDHFIRVESSWTTLENAIDTVCEIATQINVEFSDKYLYNDRSVPDEALQQIADQAERIGFIIPAKED